MTGQHTARDKAAQAKDHSRTVPPHHTSCRRSDDQCRLATLPGRCNLRWPWQSWPPWPSRRRPCLSCCCPTARCCCCCSRPAPRSMPAWAAWEALVALQTAGHMGVSCWHQLQPRGGQQHQDTAAACQRLQKYEQQGGVLQNSSIKCVHARFHKLGPGGGDGGSSGTQLTASKEGGHQPSSAPLLVSGGESATEP